jgi:LmbE family N-acetylglucosaminyl deacetylase
MQRSQPAYDVMNATLRDAIVDAADAASSVLVISPHLDDAVFSCGDMLAAHPGATVATVFAAGPLTWHEPTTWDQAAGFRFGENAMTVRRDEDQAALEVLAARPVWMPFQESQYGHPAALETIEVHLESVLNQSAAETVFIPLGLWDPDHHITHQACMSLVRRYAHLTWFVYEEAIYRRRPDAGLERRLTGLARSGVRAARMYLGPRPVSLSKRLAVMCYRSQLMALSAPDQPGHADLFRPERYWRLLPASTPNN